MLWKARSKSSRLYKSSVVVICLIVLLCSSSDWSSLELIIEALCSKVCKNVSMFLTPPSCSMEAKVVEKKLNRGGGMGWKFVFHIITAKLIDCLKTKLKTAEKSLIVMFLDVWNKETSQSSFIRFLFFLPFPLYRGFSKSKLSFQTQKRCPLYRGVR